MTCHQLVTGPQAPRQAPTAPASSHLGRHSGPGTWQALVLAHSPGQQAVDAQQVFYVLHGGDLPAGTAPPWLLATAKEGP